LKGAVKIGDEISDFRISLDDGVELEGCKNGRSWRPRLNRLEIIAEKTFEFDVTSTPL
jgi:hypothetical protein